MGVIAGLINLVISLLILAVIAGVVVNWLIVLNIVDLSNRYVKLVCDLVYRVTEPLLAPIRRVLPTYGGLDFSPVVLILILLFVQNLVTNQNPVYAIFDLIAAILSIAIFVVIVCAVMTWMIAFGAINMRNQFVYMVYDSLTRMCDPLLNPIRRFVPSIAGIDLSFIVLIVILYVVRGLLP